MNPHADLYIRLIDTFEEFMTQLRGNGFDLFNQGKRRGTQHDFFARRSSTTA